jgi:ABC-type transport system involved in Fe-S cluster assembly fused permease/ATPase subunit
MENGAIVAQGNHQGLLDLKSKYYDLWRKQALV